MGSLNRNVLLAGAARIRAPNMARSAHAAAKRHAILQMTGVEVARAEVVRSFTSGEEMDALLAERRKYRGGHAHTRENQRRERQLTKAGKLR